MNDCSNVNCPVTRVSGSISIAQLQQLLNWTVNKALKHLLSIPMEGLAGAAQPDELFSWDDFSIPLHLWE